MKKMLAIILSFAVVFMAGCVTIQIPGGENDPSETGKSPETTLEADKTETTVADETIPEETEPASEEATTEDAGGQHVPEEPETDESGMRYSYKWLSGYYEAEGADGASCAIYFYENGTFSAQCEYEDWGDGDLGSYVIIGDTVYLQSWFHLGGGVGTDVAPKEYVMGINMDKTLISGTYFQENQVFHEVTGSAAEDFLFMYGWDRILNDTPLYNNFYFDHPELF